MFKVVSSFKEKRYVQTLNIKGKKVQKSVSRHKQTRWIPSSLSLPKGEGADEENEEEALAFVSLCVSSLSLQNRDFPEETSLSTLDLFHLV